MLPRRSLRQRTPPFFFVAYPVLAKRKEGKSEAKRRFSFGTTAALGCVAGEGACATNPSGMRDGYSKKRLFRVFQTNEHRR